MGRVSMHFNHSRTVHRPSKGNQPRLTPNNDTSSSSRMLVFTVATGSCLCSVYLLQDQTRSRSSQAVLRELQHQFNYLTVLVQSTSVVLVAILRYCMCSLPCSHLHTSAQPRHTQPSIPDVVNKDTWKFLLIVHFHFSR